MGVNSLHHQAVKDLAKGLVSMAESDDGICEAAYDPEHRFVLGVQWHPEFRYESDADSMALFSSFAAACNEYRATKKK